MGGLEPPFVVLRPVPLEFGRHREDYDVLVRALSAEGFRVELQAPIEERWDGIQHASADLLVYILEGAATGVAGAITTVIIKTLGNKVRRPKNRQEPRRAAMFGPDGEVITTVEIPDLEPDDDPA
jgi:hypothetical protein